MAENGFEDILASDSDDDEFLGFELADLNDIDVTEIDPNDIEIDDEDLREIQREIYQEERDPSFEAYDCEWLTPYVQNSGPKNVPEESTPYEIFRLYFDDEIIDLLVTQTNLYYDQYIQAKGLDNLPRFSRARSWRPVDFPEMKVFLAIVIFMGLVRMPNYDMYWSTHDLILLKHLTSYMSRDRFLNILSFLHAADNSQAPVRDSPDFDPGYKIRELSVKLVQKWQNKYQPHREVSVDETLVPFKGRTKLLQYIPSKPHKWGIKVWTLADSTSSYVYNWQLYTGKMRDDNTGRGAAHRIVMSLCEPLLQNGHHLYCDNFFTSPALFHELAENQTGACGTLRSNRVGVPAEVKRAKPNKGDPPFLHSDGRNLFITWCDKRLVHLLTTVHNGSTFTKRVRSRFHENYVREVDHPKAVQLYTKYMGGVDLADQQTSYCVILHRMLKWWKKLFLCNLLEVCLANAKVIFKELNPNKRVKTEKFRLAVISGLLEGYQRQGKPFKRPVNNPSSRLTERHFPKLNPKQTNGGRRSNPDCEVCSNRAEKKRHQTPYICPNCDVPLCPYPCFERYHTLQNYKVTCSKELHE